MKVRSWLNYTRSEGDIVYVDPVSQTQPDMAKSLKELLRLHTRGIEIPIKKMTFQDDDDDTVYPDVRSMDLTEIEALRDATKASIAKARENLRKGKIVQPAPSKAPEKPSDGLSPSPSAEKSEDN